MVTTVFRLNRASTKALDDMMPYEAWSEDKTPVHFLRVFKCVAHVKAIKPHAKKLDDHSIPMVFLRYEDGGKTYKVFDPVTKHVYITCDVIFDEERS